MSRSSSSPLGKIGAVAGVLILFALIAAIFVRPTTVSTGPDQAALHYTGGAFTPTRFADCVEKSTRVWDGPGDKHFLYPTSQRNYVFGPGGDRGIITFVTSDGIEMSVEGVMNFMLNTECETLREFHDLIGNRYDAYMNADSGNGSKGWLKMLSVYMSKPLETAIDRASQEYTYTDLYTDPATKALWEQDVLDLLPDLVGRQIDGDSDFFINFAITLGKPVPPEAVKLALEKQQADVAGAKAKEAEANAQVKAAEAQVAVEKAEADKIREIVKVLGVEGYLHRYAIDQGQNPFQPSTGSLITGNQ